MNIQFLIILFTAISVLVFCVIVWIFMTEKRLKKFFAGKKAKDLEETITKMITQISELENAKKNIEKDLINVNKKLRKSIRGLETIRFNPFKDQGSNQSFAVGLLNEDGDGVVLSSLYSRERMSVFAKPIKEGKSEYGLTKEEVEVLEKAKI